MRRRRNRVKGFKVGKHFQRWTDTAQMLKTFRYECKAQELGVEAAMATALIAFIRAEDAARTEPVGTYFSLLAVARKELTNVDRALRAEINDSERQLPEAGDKLI